MTLRCPRCSEAGTGYEGCSTCAAEGVFVNLTTPLADLGECHLDEYPGGVFSWRNTLPIALHVAPVTLGEGNTPDVGLRTEPGSGPLWIKNEGTNPTWSHKDRAMCVALTKAKEIGASTVVVASSGNAGASAAAYSARAGLDCIVLTTVGISPPMQQILAGLGAILVGYESRDDRNRMLQAAVDQLGWYPAAFADARVGGNSDGIEGYKSIAYELARDHGADLESVVVPTARADLISGIGRGFQELQQAGLIDTMPALVAAEVSTGAAFSRALSEADHHIQERTQVVRHPSPAWSIGNAYAHWQGLNALRISGGHAVAVDEDRYLRERERVGREDGLYVEISSAVGIAVARDLAARSTRDTVAISTSIGLKDPDLPGVGAAQLTVLKPGIQQLDDWVARTRHQA